MNCFLPNQFLKKSQFTNFHFKNSKFIFLFHPTSCTWSIGKLWFFLIGWVKNNSLFTNLKNHNSLIPQSSIKSLNSYFLLHSHENQAQVMGWQGWDSIFIHSYILDSYLPNLRNPSNIMISPVTKVSNTTNAGSLLAYSAVNRDLINSS